MAAKAFQAGVIQSRKSAARLNRSLRDASIFHHGHLYDAPALFCKLFRFIDAAPITSISFDDAQGFVEKLMKSTGERYRVPSEAEWEYACRAGSQTRYSFGDHVDATMASFAAAAGPIAAGTFRPNAFGLYDMHGNVREWTADLWHESYDSTPSDGSPATDGHGSMRVVRGGGWCDDASLLRSAARMRATQSVRSQFIGLRIARALG